MTNPSEIKLSGLSLIGNLSSSANETLFYGINPTTGEKLDPAYCSATKADVGQAVKMAASAFLIYRRYDGAQKAKFLRTIAEQIEALGDTLTNRMMQETGLPRVRAEGERARTVGQLKMFADLVEEGSWTDVRIDHGDSKRTPIPKPDLRMTLQGIGPVAIFGPSNFPLAFGVAGGDTASALAAGCSVVVKAHPSHPGTAELVGSAVRRAVSLCGMPEGVFSLIHDSGHEAGTELVKHPGIRAVAFTGSKKGGRELFNLAAARPIPIPVLAEMSSSNPVFILPGVLAERAGSIAKGLHGSVNLGVGQFCTNPGLVVFRHSKEDNGFITELKALMETTDSASMLNNATQSMYKAGVKRLGNDTRVKTLVEGGIDSRNCHQVKPALFQIAAKDFLEDGSLAEEIFGPTTLLVGCSSKDELLDVVQSLEGNLTATIHGTDEDLECYGELIQFLELKVGRLVFNGYPTGVEVCSAMTHGGPYPATTDARFTSVGTAAIYRFARPISYQDCPTFVLPNELKDKLK